MSEAITLTSSVRELRGVGPEMFERFSKLGVHTVQDLIEHLPRRVEDRSQLRDIRELTNNTPLVVRGVIEKVSSRVSQRGVFIISAKVNDSTGTVTALWFNQRFLLGTLKPGRQVTLYGEKRPIKSMGYPFIVKKIIDEPEMAPIYPLTHGLTQTTLQKILRECRGLVDGVADVLPPKVLAQAQLPNRSLALRAAHFVPTEEAVAAAIQLLGYEELFIVCLAALKAKRMRQQQQANVQILSRTNLEKTTNNFAYPLTASQKGAITEIAEDLSKPFPMNRLLYGEVGSGKTAVGLVVSALVAAQKMKVLWLSPTVTLANQQGAVTSEFASKLGLKTALVTSATKQNPDSANIIIGTHALLHTKTIDKVGLVIIDEQQRFGVEQRNRLLDRYPGAHLLMLSATPIPRTLAHTLFGHLEISYLTEKPGHQQPIVTRIFREMGRTKVEEHIQKRIAAGQPGFVICPLIEEQTTNDGTIFEQERKAVMSEYKRIKNVFPSARVGLIHGKLSAPEKEQAMTQFHAGSLDILVATSVVEVGIDNPNATWVLVEEADRFGLSQLHQLRGRVGRGDRPSVCFLHNSLSTERATERLNALVGAKSGLEIAELDLALRGPGDIAGHDQSGLPGVRYADLGNAKLVREVYWQAEEFVGNEKIAAYPNLERAVRRLTNYGLAAT